MFRKNLIKYVKLLDTPFLVGFEGENGKKDGSGEEVKESKEVSISEEEVKESIESEVDKLSNRKKKLEGEIKELERKVEEATAQAQRILEEAREEAEKIKSEIEEKASQASQDIIDRAKKEAEGIKKNAYDEGYKEGYEKGFSEGYEKGLKEGKAEYEELVGFLKSVIDEIKNAKEKLLEEVEPEVIEVLKILIRKIILKEAKLDEELVIRVIKTAIKKLEERSKIVVRVNPEDLPEVVDRREEFFKSIEGLKELEIIEDPRVGKGGCIVEGGLGVVDARIEKQVEEIEKLIDKILREGREDVA